MLKSGLTDKLQTHRHGKIEEAHNIVKLAVPASQEQPEQDSNSSCSTRRGSLCSADINPNNRSRLSVQKIGIAMKKRKKWSEHKSQPGTPIINILLPKSVCEPLSGGKRERGGGAWKRSWRRSQRRGTRPTRGGPRGWCPRGEPWWAWQHQRKQCQWGYRQRWCW